MPSNRRANIRRSSGDLFNIRQDRAGDALSTGSRDRYEFWSVISDRKGNATPWTSLGLAKDILEEHAALSGDVKVLVTLDDNGYIPQNLDLVGEPVRNVLRSLLAQANAEVTVNPDGDYVIFDPRAALKDQPDVAATGGFFSAPDLSRVRPKRVKVYFQKEVERRLRSDATLGRFERTSVIRGRLDKNLNIYMDNVVQIPFEMKYRGRTWPANSWVDHKHVIEYLGSNDAEAAGDKIDVEKGKIGDPPTPTGWGEALFLWGMGANGTRLTQAVSREFFEDPVNKGNKLLGVNQRRARWMSALVQSFGRFYQISPDAYAHVYRMFPQTTEFIDNVENAGDPAKTNTWVRRPALVYTEWYEEATQYGALDRKLGYPPIANYTSFDAADAIKDNKATAPFALRVVDEARGVVEMQPLMEAGGSLTARKIGNTTKPPIIHDPKLRASDVTKTAWDVGIKRRPVVKAVVTFIEGTPNSRFGMHAESFTAEGAAFGPVLELFHRGETAKFDVDERLRNAGVVRSIAQAEAEAVLETYRDRPLGMLTAAFNPEDAWLVSSHVSAIVYSCDANGNMAVTVAATEAPSAPNVASLLPMDVRAFVQRSSIDVEGRA